MQIIYDPVTGLQPDGASATFGVTLSANQTGVASGAWAQVLFDSVIWDTISGWDNTNHYYKPNVAGYYQVNAMISLDTGNLGTRLIVAILTNAGIYARIFDGGSCYLGSGSAIVYLNGSTDWVGVSIYQTHDNPGAIANDFTSTSFSGCLVA